MRIEYSKSGYLFSYSPNRLLTKNLIEQAESIFQQFHIYLQAAENKEIIFMEIEYFEDISHRL